MGVALRHGLIREGAEAFLARQTAYITLDALEAEPIVDVFVADDVKKIRQLATRRPLVLCANFQSRADVAAAFQAGAHACISIEAKFENLASAIGHAFDHQRYLCPRLSAVMHRVTKVRACSDLTQRELEVLEWIAKGYSSKQIGRQLGVSPHTVDSHRRNVMQKLGIHKATVLARHVLMQESLGQ